MLGLGLGLGFGFGFGFGLELRQCLGQLGLAHACRPHEQEGAEGTLRRLQPG